MIEFGVVVPPDVTEPVAVIEVVPAWLVIAQSSTTFELELTAIEPVFCPMKLMPIGLSAFRLSVVISV